MYTRVHYPARHHPPVTVLHTVLHTDTVLYRNHPCCTGTTRAVQGPPLSTFGTTLSTFGTYFVNVLDQFWTRSEPDLTAWSTFARRR